MVCLKDVEKVIRARNGNRRECEISRVSDPVLMVICIRGLKNNPNLARVRPTVIRETHGVSTRRNAITTRQFSLARALNSPIRPEAMVFLVNALLLATRGMMSSGAMTCSTRHCIIQPVQRSGLWECTNLSLSKQSHK